MTPPQSLPTRVAIYTRKSTDAGPDKEANSLEVQREAVDSYIRAQNRKDLIILEERFDDNNASGGTMDRPAMNRLIQKIENGEIEAVAIHRLDRISRSLLQFLELLGFFERKNIALICVTQNFDTGSSFGKMVVSLLMTFAEFERDMIRDRVTDRIHAARKKGRFIGGRAILGYIIVPEGRALAVEELEAIRVRAIFELYLKLRSVNAVVKELKRRGWNNKKWVTRDGKATGGNPFTNSTLHNLLTNPLYIGKVTLKGKVYEGVHDGIVAPEVFAKVQEMLTDNCPHQGNLKRNTHNALLKGLLICKHCNAPFTHTNTKKGANKLYRYYTCSNKRMNGADACPSTPLSAGEIESLIVDQLMSIGTNPELQNMVYRQLVTAIDEKSHDAKRAHDSAKRQMDRLNKELATSREYGASEALLKHLEEKRQEAKTLLENFHASPYVAKPSRQAIAATIQNMASMWPKFGDGEKCAFVKTLVNNVVYDAVEGSITINFNDEGFLADGMGGEA